MPADLSGLVLDRAIAEAMGWMPIGDDDYPYMQRAGDPGFYALPSYSTSLDALRDGPWKILRARGYIREHRETRINNGPDAYYEDRWVMPGEPVPSWTESLDEVRSAARATLSALEAMKND